MAGVIDPSSLKIYQCTTWADGDSHGGDINTSAEITSGADQNIFPDITDAQRISGVTLYRKIFFRNENTATYEGVKCWISQQTLATNDSISIALGTPSGTRLSEGAGLIYVAPDSKVHADVLSIGDLAEDAYKAVWIKKVVTAGGYGYSENSSIIAFESS